MALEPAGVSLQAARFKDYLSKLDTIDKKQREVFDTEFKGTKKSFSEVKRAAKKYETELKKLANAEKKAADEAKRLAASQKTAAATQRQAAISTANVILDIAKQIATFANESARLAATFNAQQKGLQNLAASFGQSGSAIQSSIVKASKGTLSGLDAMKAANEALLLGVAKTPEEFAKFTRAALVLGRTVGLTAEQSISKFTTALGRESLLRLDDFGSKAAEVNREIERLAQAELGKLPEQLTVAEKSAIFVQAALNATSKNVDKIGDSAGEAVLAFERLDALGQDLKITFGETVRPAASRIAVALTQAGKTLQQVLAIVAAGRAGIIALFNDAIQQAFLRLKQLVGIGKSFVNLFRKEPLEIKVPDIEALTLSQALDRAGDAAIDRFKEIASTIAGVSFPGDEIAEPFENQADAIEEATQNLQAYQSAIKQAETLQLSFARAAEDAALKLARANEDIARKQTKAVLKLEDKQAKDRDKLLDRQIKELDKFDKDRQKQITKAEGEITKERQAANDKRRDDQKKLQQDLEREREKFNLSQLQAGRRFSLSERRLIAEGDILAVQRLREDRELEREEDRENFRESQTDRGLNAKKQQKIQDQDLETRINELKSNLEDQRTELLKSFDEQETEQRQQQIEAQELQKQGFIDAAIEREISLRREEEDRRISQARQLEDLGRSLVDQEGVTAEGSLAIANELEKVFGLDGVASNIMTGFTEKTESDFTDLFDNLKSIVNETDLKPKLPIIPLSAGGGGARSRIGGIPEFDNGGVIPGPVGSPQIIRARAGEIVLPPHQQSFTMAAPIIPSQSLEVLMSGGFNITGDGQGNEAILQAATAEMTENFKIAVRRLERRN